MYAIVGAYTFSNMIWEVLENLQPSKRGEYEITDAIQILIDQGYQVAYSITTEPFFDIGTPERWLDANRYKMNKDTRRHHIEHLLQNSGVVIHPPVHIDPSVKLNRSTIGPYVYIGPGCVVNDCQLENSILTDHVQLYSLSAKDSIFGSNVELSGPVKQSKPTTFIIGDKSSILDG